METGVAAILLIGTLFWDLVCRLVGVYGIANCSESRWSKLGLNDYTCRDFGQISVGTVGSKFLLSKGWTPRFY